VQLVVEDCVGERSPGRLFRQAHMLVQSRMERCLASGHSSLRHWRALKLLDFGSKARAGSRDLGISAVGITQFVDALEYKGWISRSRSNCDRREVNLTLRAMGRKELRRLTAIVAGTWNESLAQFTEEDVAEFARPLGLLKQGLETSSPRNVEATQ
jgi:DNA-binding MarR family transcriptional regulator